MIATETRPLGSAAPELEAPAESILLKTAEPVPELPPADAYIPASERGTQAAVNESLTTERTDGNFPPHMLRWAIIGVVAYFAIIAAAMIYAAVLSPAAIR
jgi:hypothetical protein